MPCWSRPRDSSTQVQAIMAERNGFRWPHRVPQTVLSLLFRKTTVNFQAYLRMDRRPTFMLSKSKTVVPCLPTIAVKFKCHRNLLNYYLRPLVGNVAMKFVPRSNRT